MIKEIGSYIYDETENGAVILECDKNISGDVEIQESFFGVPVVGIAAFAFMKCKRMLGVQIPDSVTEIGRGAFYGCTEMRSAVLPANIRDISEWTFDSCTNLFGMVLPSGIVSIGSRAFGQCRSLSEIYLPDTVEYIAGDAFEDCICLESVNVAKGNEHYINDQNVLFSADMTELVLCMSDDFVDDFAVPYTVRRIGEGAFCNWTELERLELSDETEEIGARAFSG